MRSEVTAFERIIVLTPAFDKRHTDPKKNYGVHGVDLRMVLKGAFGAIQFVLYTNWQLPHVQAETDSRPLNQFPYMFHKPQPADIGYHWHSAQYEGQSPMPCEYVSSGQCYYDGSCLQAEDVYEILVREGSEGVWRELERRYHELANRQESP